MKSINKIYDNSLEKILKNIFNKINYGNLKVTFPSGKIENFRGINNKFNADITLNNFEMIHKLSNKGSIGFAESYMDSDFSTTNLTNLLFLAEINKKNFISFFQERIFF